MSEPDAWACFKVTLENDTPEMVAAAMSLMAGRPEGVVLGPPEVYGMDDECVTYRVPMKRYESEGLA